METQDFEKWVYSEPALEDRLEETLYLEIISTDYSNRDSIYQIKELLSEYATQVYRFGCRCIQLPNVAVVDMGDETDEVYKSLAEIKVRGEPYWWLSLYQCRECEQWWLVAQEERQNDVVCFRRLDKPAVEKLLHDDIWPTDFDKYETLLRLGLEAGKRVRFVGTTNTI